MKLGPEDRIQISILDYLEAVAPHVLFFAVPNEGKRSYMVARRHKLLGMVAGVPDLVLTYEGRAYFLEVKSAVGRLRPAQKLFIEAAHKAGAKCAVVRSIEDVRAALGAWGIPTREASYDHQAG
jgi:hypothetical protein